VTSSLRILSWNVRNGGGRRRAQQLEVVFARDPAVVALQEVTAPSLEAFGDAFAAAGMHVVDSFRLAPHGVLLRGPRRYGQLIASRWPLQTLPPEEFPIPWPERVLSARVYSPWGQVELHTTHIPPGASNGWIKIETLEGIYDRLARPSAMPRILCGDFNTPKEELTDGTVVTWARPKRGQRWEAGERNVVCGLAAHGLPDVFRGLHGYGTSAASIVIRGRPRRYDHVFASPELRPEQCTYLHEARDRGLSDHAPVEVVFSPRARG
jgi:endonuclease/exonuclease/phosphatase family metal-dependent hydrolase